MSKLIGLGIVILMVLLIGTTGYISYDFGHSDGYSSGYYSGKQSCITDYQNRINSLNQQISEQQTKIQRCENGLVSCKSDLSEYVQAYTICQQNLRNSQQNVQNWKGEYYEVRDEATVSQRENVELRSVINQLQAEIETLRAEQPSSDFEEIDDLLALLAWLLF